MKKIICVVICLAILVICTGCGSKLPKGEASRIDFTDGWTIQEATFEYISENTVRIVRASDGQVFYVPYTNIHRIWIK